MKETIMRKTWGFSISELKVRGEEEDTYTASMVRLYQASPKAAELQIRHFGPTSASGLGKARMMVAHAVLTLEEIKELAAALNDIIVSAAIGRSEVPNVEWAVRELKKVG